MALDYSGIYGGMGGIGGLSDNLFNQFDDSGNLVQMISDGQNGNRAVTQADIDALVQKQQQQYQDVRQGVTKAGGVWAGADPSVRPSNVPDSWVQFNAPNGGGSYWGPSSWEAPHWNDSFFSGHGFFAPDAYDPRALISEMPGLPILLAPLAGAAAGAGAGAGTAVTPEAVAGVAGQGVGAATAAGTVAGTSGAQTLAGGSDTLGGSTIATADPALAGGGEVGSGYAASAPATASTSSAETLGGSTMTNGYFDDFTGQWVDTPPADPNATGAFDQFGSMSNPTAAGAPTFDGADAAFGNQVGADNSTIFGGTASDPFGTGSSSSLSLNDLKNALNAYKLLSGGSANGGGLFGGGGGLFGGGGLGATAARSAPGLMALAYAAGQPGIDTGQLNAILGRLGGNQDAVVKAATDPVNANIAAGYGDLVQSQALRGIRGSSFGDTDIGNYIATTGNTLANAGANAAEGSLALQGNLAGNIASLRAQSQKMKNDLYGRAFDVLGRGLNPGGYAGTTNVNVGGGATPAGGAPSSASPGIDWTKLLPLATSAFNFAAG